MSRTRREDEHHKVHASGLYNFCARRHAISNKHELKVEKNKIRSELALTFEIGSKIQDIVIEHLPHSGIGEWHCLSCKEVYYSPYPNKCGSCGGPSFKYKEVGLSYKAGAFDIVCHFDGFVRYDAKSVYPIEIKSIRQEDFDVLAEPSVAYAYQITTGLWLAKKAKHKAFPYKIKYDKAFIIYVCKSHKKLPIKVFEVKPNPTAVKLLNSACKELQTYSKTKKLPKRICATTHHLMAKTCGLKEVCFQHG